MKRILLSIITITALNFGASAQNVNIPDANFKARLLAHGYSYTGSGIGIIDSNQDGEIQVAEAASYTGKIAATGANISDMTGIEAFTNAPNLYCDNNNITTLDVSNNTQLIELQCFNNSLTSLDLSSNTNLISLYCVMNSISSLNVSGLTQLTSINCSLNQLISLDLSTTTAISTLDCSDNLLTTLIPSNSLDNIICQNNQLTSLDFSGCFGMIELNCSNNDLSSLNIANWNNSNLSTFDATVNPNLTCIQVNNVAWCTANHTVGGGQIDSGVSFSTNCSACTVTIPDANFKAYLVGNTAINTNGDTEIQCSEASAFTGTISCTALSISDLTGIEGFTSLTGLICGNNLLTSLDLTSNSELINLSCPNNQLTSLNLGACTQLTTLYFYTNAISSLNLSNCISLIEIGCYLNQLNTLDVTNNVDLIYLNCHSNLLTTIDLSQNIALTELICHDNSLSVIDVGSNTAFEYIECQNNSMTSLNVANGNNTNMTWLDATNNPNLTCIQTDDAIWSTTNWTVVSGYIDATASFSLDCSTIGIDEFIDKQISMYPNPATNQVTIDTDEQIESILIFDLFGSLVQQESTASFSIEELSSGIYSANIQTNAGIVRVRFVKQ